MELIDTHAHLYSPKFDSDRREMVERAIAAGVVRMYLPNIDSSSTAGMLALEAEFPDHCFAMMGLHPCSVQPGVWEKELEDVERRLGERHWAGIGETGIDLYWDKTTLDIQEQSFARQLGWAKDLGRPIIIHSRESNEECIRMVQEAQDGRLRGIFHCFSGTTEQAQRIIDAGFVLGIGGTLTYAKSELPGVLRDISLEYIVLETDAPYLPPVPHRGKRNETAFIRHVAEVLADVKGATVDSICEATTKTAIRVFS